MSDVKFVLEEIPHTSRFSQCFLWVRVHFDGVTHSVAHRQRSGNGVRESESFLICDVGLGLAPAWPSRPALRERRPYIEAAVLVPSTNPGSLPGSSASLGPGREPHQP